MQACKIFVVCALAVVANAANTSTPVPWTSTMWPVVTMTPGPLRPCVGSVVHDVGYALDLFTIQRGTHFNSTENVMSNPGAGRIADLLGLFGTRIGLLVKKRGSEMWEHAFHVDMEGRNAVILALGRHRAMMKNETMPMIEFAGVVLPDQLTLGCLNVRIAKDNGDHDDGDKDHSDHNHSAHNHSSHNSSKTNESGDDHDHDHNHSAGNHSDGNETGTNASNGNASRGREGAVMAGHAGDDHDHDHDHHDHDDHDDDELKPICGRQPVKYDFAVGSGELEVKLYFEPGMVKVEVEFDMTTYEYAAIGFQNVTGDGRMTFSQGTDVIVLGSQGGTKYAVDSRITGYGAPSVDAQQDWMLVMDNDTDSVAATRAYEVNDTDDWSFHQWSRMIWSLGKYLQGNATVPTPAIHNASLSPMYSIPIPPVVPMTVAAMTAVAANRVLTGKYFVMDKKCIDDGVFLDDKNTATLEHPEKHSIHCLAEVSVCVDSGYVLLTKAPGAANYSVLVDLDTASTHKVRDLMLDLKANHNMTFAPEIHVAGLVYEMDEKLMLKCVDVAAPMDSRALLPKCPPDAAEECTRPMPTATPVPGDESSPPPPPPPMTSSSAPPPPPPPVGGSEVVPEATITFDLVTDQALTDAEKTTVSTKLKEEVRTANPDVPESAITVTFEEKTARAVTTVVTITILHASASAASSGLQSSLADASSALSSALSSSVAGGATIANVQVTVVVGTATPEPASSGSKSNKGLFGLLALLLLIPIAIVIIYFVMKSRNAQPVKASPDATEQQEMRQKEAAPAPEPEATPEPQQETA